MSELYHHGVLGMRWGVRRYQNPDGTLTPAGKKKMSKISENPRLQKRHSKKAVKLYTRSAKQNEALSTTYENRANDVRKKGYTLFNKKTNMLSRQKEVTYRDKAEEYMNSAKIYRKKISDIKNENMRAGRDFMIQTDIYLFDKGQPTISKRVIERE